VRDFIGMSEKNPTVMMTSAKSNKGMIEFAKKLRELMESQKKSKKQKEESRLDTELKDIILNNVKNKVSNMIDSSNAYTKYLKKVQKKEMDPFEAADKMFKLLK
ncbi:MAG: methylmalonyl Co-A mutase-associated GTPase MeaB, partial [Nitrosotalea sp.]